MIDPLTRDGLTGKGHQEKRHDKKMPCKKTLGGGIWTGKAQLVAHGFIVELDIAVLKRAVNQ